MRTAGLLLTDRNGICPKLVSLVKDFVGTDCQRNDRLMVQNGTTHPCQAQYRTMADLRFQNGYLQYLVLAENVYLFV